MIHALVFINSSLFVYFTGHTSPRMYLYLIHHMKRPHSQNQSQKN